MKPQRWRRGASTPGCLFTLLLFAAAVYFGVNVFEVYWRSYQFEDDMKQQIRFAANLTNDQLVKSLRSSADSLHLPDDAKDIYVTRTGRTITVEAEYDDFIELPFYVRVVHFNPKAERSY